MPTFTFTDQEADIVYQALSAQPFNVVAPTIQAMQKQIAGERKVSSNPTPQSDVDAAVKPRRRGRPPKANGVDPAPAQV